MSGKQVKKLKSGVTLSQSPIYRLRRRNVRRRKDQPKVKTAKGISGTNDDQKTNNDVKEEEEENDVQVNVIYCDDPSEECGARCQYNRCWNMTWIYCAACPFGRCIGCIECKFCDWPRKKAYE